MNNWNLNKFQRVRTGDVLGGVCTGLARYTPIAAGWWRLAFIVFGIHGFGILAYLLLCFCFSSED